MTKIAVDDPRRRDTSSAKPMNRNSMTPTDRSITFLDRMLTVFLAAVQTDFEHRETGLHEQHQHGADEHDQAC